MNKEEVIKNIKELIESGNEDMNYLLDGDIVDNLIEGINFQIVYEKGGYEGEGERVERVLEVSDGKETFFVKITGHYSSWEGTDWSYGTVKEVQPYTFTETRYK